MRSKISRWYKLIARPTRNGFSVLALVWLLLALPVAAEEAAPPAPVESWYAATFARGGSGFLITHYWAKGGRLRTQTVAGHRLLITIVDATTYYVIDPTTATGIAIERSELAKQGDAQRTRPFGDELTALLRAGGERIGAEEREGVQLDRYQLTNDAGRIQIWVQPESRLPVRVERYVRSSSAREYVDYLNWRENPEIADSFFEPEARFEIERVGYEEYVRRAMEERLGPAPPFYAHLLHGEPAAESISP